VKTSFDFSLVELSINVSHLDLDNSNLFPLQRDNIKGIAFLWKIIVEQRILIWSVGTFVAIDYK
jgi:hypothetical protein